MIEKISLARMEVIVAIVEMRCVVMMSSVSTIVCGKLRIEAKLAFVVKSNVTLVMI